MADPIPQVDIPAGAIPEEEFHASTPAALPSGVPAGAIPAEQFQSDQDKYGSGTEMLKTAVEQGLSGATLGGSKVLQTKLGISTPEDIAGREAANPVTATVANIGGTAALLGTTGGISGIAEGAGAAARIGAGAIEGAGIGGINQVTDDWSQNKALDAQKIAASAGLGALLGGAGAGIFEGIRAKFSPLAKVAPEVEENAASAIQKGMESAAPPVDLPVGVQPTSFDGISAKVNAARAKGDAIPLPAKNELADALSRVGMENPVNPLQLDSLGSQEARDIYQVAKESPGSIGPTMQNYEAIQKAELVNRTAQAIKDVSPGIVPTSDAVEGGGRIVKAFTDQYQTEKQALAPVFKQIKKLPIQEDLLPNAVVKMTEAVPGISNMFDTTGAEIGIHPYKTTWGIDKATYNAVKEAVNSLEGADNNLESLWNVRKGLDQHIDVLAQGQAPSEIRAIKAALMDQMQEASGDPGIREAFKRYAINEQQRAVIEKTFGASVGAPEFGQISKIKPEMIGDKIFGNTATVEAAKKILPQAEFQGALANWISEAKAAATDKGAFSSNKFGSFLRRNQDALNVAFSDNPAQLQHLRDLTTIMRILPDAASVNPSGTAKTVVRMLKDADLHNITWEGLLASIPKEAMKAIDGKLKMNQLNKALSGQSLKNAQSTALKENVDQLSKKIESGVRSMMVGTSSQSRKAK